jgi:hypothetical protein
MRKLLMTGLLVCSMSAMAGQIEVIPHFGPYNAGTGGEYTVLPDFAVGGYVSGVTSDLVQDGTFQTFCVERSERITGGTFDVAPNNVTVASGKILNLGAAWLYQQFAQATLAGYDYSPAGRVATAKVLQDDLWFLMGWGGAPGEFANLAMDEFGANWSDPNNGTYPVAILNLWSVGQRGGKIARQDVLVLLPNGVPDGGLTLALLGLGLGSLGFVSRKFRR